MKEQETKTKHAVQLAVIFYFFISLFVTCTLNSPLSVVARDQPISRPLHAIHFDVAD